MDPEMECCADTLYGDACKQKSIFTNLSGAKSLCAKSVRCQKVTVKIMVVVT